MFDLTGEMSPSHRPILRIWQELTRKNIAYFRILWFGVCIFNIILVLDIKIAPTVDVTSSRRFSLHNGSKCNKKSPHKQNIICFRVACMSCCKVETTYMACKIEERKFFTFDHISSLRPTEPY